MLAEASEPTEQKWQKSGSGSHKVEEYDTLSLKGITGPARPAPLKKKGKKGGKGAD